MTQSKIVELEDRRGGATLHIPVEGEDGLFSESWFPIIPSAELKPGQIAKVPFLDGHVIAARGESGRAEVLSPFCPHLGAGLDAGKMVGDAIQCPFHHWEFGLEGKCLRTGIGDPVPPTARLFRFPTIERYGMIFAWNGLEPAWQLPDMPLPDARLSIRARYDVPRIPVDPWVICANTPDWQHIATVHELEFEMDGILDSVEWTDHSMEYDLVAKLPPEMPFRSVRFRAGIYGASIFCTHGYIDDTWFASMTPFGLPEAGQTQNYFVTMLDKGSADAAETEAMEMMHMQLFYFGKQFTDADRPIFHSLRYRPGTLTRSDKLLVRYLRMLQDRPRSHHSSDFIK
jgi:phenylpropionate dioxygenase-like ring-hydroxylating dioxygenase large terminal subunit